MPRTVAISLLCLLLSCFNASLAEGDLARRAIRLETMQIDANEGFSITSYELVTGQLYRWRIESDGRDEYELLAPTLFSQTWIQQIASEEFAIRASGINAIELEGEAEIDVYFLAVRPGRHAFFVERLRSEGFEGEFIVQ